MGAEHSAGGFYILSAGCARLESMQTSPISRILTSMRSGDEVAKQELVPAVYDELRQLAHRRLAQLPANATLQTTALVHEAWMRLDGQDDWQSRAHYFGAAARAMRLVLVDHARAQGSEKRGQNWGRVTLGDAALEEGADALDVLALDEALTRLEVEDQDKASVVMLRYFAGLGVDETAAVLRVSSATVDRRWAFARAWLKREMSRD